MGVWSLRAARHVIIENQDFYGGGLQSADLAFLSRLECLGDYINLIHLNNLTSLKGLDRVVDATPDPRSGWCTIATNIYPYALANVSALAKYARCGRPDQLSDDMTIGGRPCVSLTCRNLQTWSDLCNYGSCP